jgi:hypothetical protein
MSILKQHGDSNMPLLAVYSNATLCILKVLSHLIDLHHNITFLSCMEKNTNEIKSNDKKNLNIPNGGITLVAYNKCGKKK